MKLLMMKEPKKLVSDYINQCKNISSIHNILFFRCYRDRRWSFMGQGEKQEKKALWAPARICWCWCWQLRNANKNIKNSKAHTIYYEFQAFLDLFLSAFVSCFSVNLNLNLLRLSMLSCWLWLFYNFLNRIIYHGLNKSSSYQVSTGRQPVTGVQISKFVCLKQLWMHMHCIYICKKNMLAESIALAWR
jgi:hypothetical protein